MQTIPDVGMILSGMSNEAQLADNLKTFSAEKPLSSVEWDTALSIGKAMIDQVPCTACRYCIEYCPQGLDIPRLLRVYREQSFTGKGSIPARAVHAIEEAKRPDGCIGCQSCEAACPQNIKIAEMLADFSSRLDS